MTEQAKQARRDYLNKWRKANKEKCREYEKRHWEKVAARQEAQAQAQQDNPGSK